MIQRRCRIVSLDLHSFLLELRRNASAPVTLLHARVEGGGSATYYGQSIVLEVRTATQQDTKADCCGFKCTSLFTCFLCWLCALPIWSQ
mgnify:CR=1 FL=1